MRLVKISANKSSFKTVCFNRSGVSLVIGTRKDDLKTSDESRSYNGVGKSLLVEIIHFCLGSSGNANFKKLLPTWEFTLDFEIGEVNYSATRSCDKQGEVRLNEKSLKLKPYTDFLGEICFDFPHWGGSNLTFRALIAHFIRRSKIDYNDPRTTSADKEPYVTLVRNLFLLGLDINLAESKYKLRTRQVELETFERNFKNDPFIREFYTGNKDASLQSKHLEQQIERLQGDLDQFVVAEDYYQIEKEANEISIKLRLLKNRRAIVENSLSNIIRSLEARSDIPREKVLEVYNELRQAFREETLKQLSDVERFHSQLLENRIARLSQEKLKLDSEKKSLELEISNLNSSVDLKLGYLSDKRALDQYAAVSAQVSDLKAKLQKLKDYQAIMHKSREDAANIRQRLAEETIKANAYLDESNVEREARLSLFSALASKFYPDAPAGITLNNNLGDNKTRFDFDVRIEADGSDGINAVKIFCFDFFMLILQQNHSIKFIFHDSRLFSDIDPRQRAVLFQTALDESKKRGYQYIATVNQDQLDSMRAEWTEEQYQVLLECEVLRLDDDGPESKLLGIQIDMQYSK